MLNYPDYFLLFFLCLSEPSRESSFKQFFTGSAPPMAAIGRIVLYRVACAIFYSLQSSFQGKMSRTKF